MSCRGGFEVGLPCKPIMRCQLETNKKLKFLHQVTVGKGRQGVNTQHLPTSCLKPVLVTTSGRMPPTRITTDAGVGTNINQKQVCSRSRSNLLSQTGSWQKVSKLQEPQTQSDQIPALFPDDSDPGTPFVETPSNLLELRVLGDACSGSICGAQARTVRST